MTDDIERRLRAADPLRSGRAPQPSEPSLAELVEATMTMTETQPKRPAWRSGLAAAAAATILVGAGAAALVMRDDGSPGGEGAPTTLALTLPGSNSSQSCIRYSVDILADMPIAFAGTASEVSGGRVVLEVDHWYRGGDAQAVELQTPDGGDAMSSVDSVDFVTGRRYLVTASQDRSVATCGYTAEWSRGMAADFETAFGG